MLHFGTLEHLRHRRSEIFQHDNRARAAIGQLMLKLPGRVERIDIDHHETSSQDAEYSDRILQHVRHHDRHAVSVFQLRDRLQVSREVAAEPVDSREAQLCTEVRERRHLCETREARLEKFYQGRMLVRIDVRWNAGRIGVQPGSVYHSIITMSVRAMPSARPTRSPASLRSHGRWDGYDRAA